jgi:cold shock protein
LHGNGTSEVVNSTKGYGFIRPDDGGPDVFVHFNTLKKAGYSDLREGARVSYEPTSGRGGRMAAENLRVE